MISIAQHYKHHNNDLCQTTAKSERVNLCFCHSQRRTRKPQIRVKLANPLKALRPNASKFLPSTQFECFTLASDYQSFPTHTPGNFPDAPTRRNKGETMKKPWGMNKKRK